MRLVDWKNRSGDPFELKCKAREGGGFTLELNTPIPTTVAAAVPVVHGDYESRKEDDGTLVYKALPGNSMGQVLANDGRPAFGVGYDCTELDAEGRPLFKVYFGSASEWFVKNQYHARWNELRDAKAEIEPDAPKMPTQLTEEERANKERGRNPRDRKRSEEGQQASGRTRRGRRGGRGRH
jgi:hypothetical protein